MPLWDFIHLQIYTYSLETNFSAIVFQTLSQSSKKEFAQARVAGSTSKSSESSGQHGRNMKVSKTVSGKRKTRNDDDEYSPRIGPDGFVARDQTERDIVCGFPKLKFYEAVS